MMKLFDLVVAEPGYYQAALDTIVSIGSGLIPFLRLNAEGCKVEIVRRLCAEALEQLEPPKQLKLL